MHLNRGKMVNIALEVFPFDPETYITALDLGVGTGFFSQVVLRRFPNCQVIAIHGSSSTVEMAKIRLASQLNRVDFRMGDFWRLKALLPTGERGELVFSSCALHHLTGEEKLSVVSDAVSFLKPGGWFLNADLIVAADQQIEMRIQNLRVEGNVRRAAGRDDTFKDTTSTRSFLDNLAAHDQDKPLTLSEDLRILREAGLMNASAFWVEYREAVIRGFI